MIGGVWFMIYVVYVWITIILILKHYEYNYPLAWQKGGELLSDDH